MSEPYAFPLDRTNHRDLSGYEGPVDVWDIDKTYLMTEFSRLRDLIRRALEGAEEKESRPGAAALLRGLRATGGGRTPLYFVSASPPQMRSVLEEKMHLDGLEVDGITFKDHLRLLRHGRLREVKRHTAFKLTALLRYRCEWPAGAREWLYGDDAEDDARIYATYAHIRDGTLCGPDLGDRLRELRVDEDDQAAIVDLARRANELSPAPEGGSVDAIYIFRSGARSRLRLEDFPGVTPVADVLELAEDLARRERSTRDLVKAVRNDLDAHSNLTDTASPAK